MSAQVVQCLNATLSSDANTRISAELRLAEILASPEAGYALADVAASQNVELGIRYVNERWSPYFSGFKGNAPPHEIKSQIRAIILQGLSDPNQKMRSLFAQTLSTLAHSDWPDDYPELLTHLIGLVSSNSPDSVHGALQVFVEFVKSDVTEDQILPVLRDLLPVLMGIMSSSTEHSALTRSRAIKVFSQCAEYLYMVKDQHPHAVKDATSSILPVWINSFKVLLEQDPSKEVADYNDWSQLEVRLQTLNVIHTAFASSLTPHITDLMQLGIRDLHVLSSAFTSHYLLSSDGSPNSSGDGDFKALPQLATTILDFITNCSRGGKAKVWLNSDNHIGVIVEVVFLWTQITKDDEQSWETDANAFLDNEDDSGDAVGPRVAGFDVINSLLDRWPAQVARSLQHGVTHALRVAEAARQRGDQDWWRPVEAALACCSSSADDLLELVEDAKEQSRPADFDPSSLLKDVIPSLLHLQDCPFLQGRCLIFASKFSAHIPGNETDYYASIAVQAIEASNVWLPVKLCAVKALKNLCDNRDDPAIGNAAPRIAVALGQLVLHTQGDTLSAVLESLTSVISVRSGDWLNPDIASALTTAFLEAWSKNSRDPVLSSVLEDNFEALGLSRATGVYSAVLSTALPILCQSVVSEKRDEPWVQTAALEFITRLIKSGNEGVSMQQIMPTLGPALFQCMQLSTDRDILQAGVLCLTQMIRRDVSNVISWQDTDGATGLDRTLALVARLMEPSEGEAGGLVVGDLVIHLLRGGEAILAPVLPSLLQAMLSRMTTAKTATFLQSLIVPFALLLQTQHDSTLDFLENTWVPGSAQQQISGLSVLLQTWCENAETIQGLWPTRISALGLCRLFLSDRPSVRQVLVKGDMILQPETRDVIVTRSRAKQTPHQFSMIPFPTKALKLIIGELQTDGDAAAITAHNGNDFDIESDDGDEEWADEEKLIQGFKPNEFALLSEMLGPDGKNFEDDDVIDLEYEDFPEFPVLGINMKDHLISFLRDCHARNVNNMNLIVDQLTAEEILVLKRAVA